MMKSTASRFASLFLLPLASLFGAGTAQAQSFVCMDTSLGEICLELFSIDAPATVNNFLNYVNDGDYDGTFIHRSEPGFVIQGGGYVFSNGSAEEIPTDGPVINEFFRSNQRGTVSMAKRGGNANSATNEWFINLGDNSANLDRQNGGFTVFGRVIGDGMEIVDAIAGLNRGDFSATLGGAFTDVPLLQQDSNLSADDLVVLNRVYEVEAPPATGYFSGSLLSVPVEYRGTLYRMRFSLMTTPPEYVFRLRSTEITLLKDVGQERASYSAGRLVIPTISYNDTIISNVVFELTDQETWEFTLVSYDRD